MNQETQALMGLLQSPDPSNVDLARELYVHQDVDKPFFERIFKFIDKEFKRDEEGKILEWGKLNLSSRRLTAIPDELQYIYLTRLYCGGNQLTTLGEYPELTILSCEDNQLTTLGEYPKLTTLSCWKNQLTSLPEYPKLTYLYCEDNQLTSLPDYLHLTRLSCWDNQLTTLGEYPKLTHLYCGGNQLTEETEERFKKRGLL
jgi:Leucine-rich repeat (LRR) protein